jgi:hypothetical protein
MVHMSNQGFEVMFVPEASAALEHSDTWDQQLLHEYSTLIYSQSVAELIDYDELMRALAE